MTGGGATGGAGSGIEVGGGALGRIGGGALFIEWMNAANATLEGAAKVGFTSAAEALGKSIELETDDHRAEEAAALPGWTQEHGARQAATRPGPAAAPMNDAA